jgi:hypothetical protein
VAHLEVRGDCLLVRELDGEGEADGTGAGGVGFGMDRAVARVLSGV